MPAPTSKNGRTVREAIAIALEGLPGPTEEWVFSQGTSHKAMRAHLIEWVMSYAKARGVILDTKLDIEPEIQALITDLRNVFLARTK